MFYVVALGNPGEKYARTRHNAGWLAVAGCVAAWNLPEPEPDKYCRGLVTRGVVNETPVTVLFPTTFMNHSGEAVVKTVPKDSLDRLIVVYDEVALPFGTVRVAYDRGSGGHNGIESIIKAVGRQFTRVRIGIGLPQTTPGTGNYRPSATDLPAYVLERFLPAEEAVFQTVVEQVKDVLDTIFLEGREVAMNRYNQTAL